MLLTDGYAAWRTLEGVTHFGCIAHARRAFVDAHKGQKKPGGRAAQALEYFKALYQVETLARSQPPEGESRVGHTYRLRQQHSVPLLEAFKKWLDEQAPLVLPESLLGKAISYTRNQWQYLSRYVTDGRVGVDNNVLERLWIRIHRCSYPRNRIMQSPTFCALTSVVRPTALGPDVSLEELQQRNTFMLYG
jgi:transposase